MYINPNKPLYKPNDKCYGKHLLSRRIKQSIQQARKGKETEAPKPQISVTLPLFFAPFQRQKE